MKTFLNALLLIILGFTSFGQTDTTLVYTDDLIQSKKYLEAKILLDTFIEKDTTNAVAYHQRARCYRRLEQYRAAQEDALHSLVLDSTNAETYNTLGAIYALGRGKPSKMFDCFNKSIAIDSFNSQAYSGRGAVYFYWLKNDSLGLVDLNRAIQLDPTNSHAHYNRGLLNRKQKHYLAATKDFSSAIELKPEWHGAVYFRARCYNLIGEYKNAINDYTHAINNFSPSIENLERDNFKYTILYQRARCYHLVSDYENAIKDYTEVTTYNKFSGQNDFKVDLKELYSYRASCFEDIGESKNARIDRENSKMTGYKDVKH